MTPDRRREWIVDSQGTVTLQSPIIPSSGLATKVITENSEFHDGRQLRANTIGAMLLVQFCRLPPLFLSASTKYIGLHGVHSIMYIEKLQFSVPRSWNLFK